MPSLSFRYHLISVPIDLDSFTSSLLYSYIRSTHPPAKSFSPVYIPLLNLPRDRIPLRPEFSLVCEQAGIKPTNLITLDDLSVDVLSSSTTHWLLVDHNRLTGQLRAVPQEKVVGVIDHHDDEQFVPHVSDPQPRIIEKAGSCTSLVVGFCRSSWDAISSTSLTAGAAHGQGESAINDGAFTQIWDAQTAKLAMSSILIDTANLTAPGRVEQIDRDAVAYLEAKINLSPKDAKSWDRQQFYDQVKEAKADIGGLTLPDILEKDYKQWNEGNLILGISSVVKDLAFLVGKSESATFLQSLDSFMQKKGLTIFAIMTTSTSETGVFQRQLLLQAKASAVKQIEAFLLKVEELKLEEIEFDNIDHQSDMRTTDMWRKAWWQKEIRISRKQVAPMLREAMQ